MTHIISLIFAKRKMFLDETTALSDKKKMFHQTKTAAANGERLFCVVF